MHLGIIDRPFVPHNLISAQYSPVPLLKLQMTPRLKILITSGSKKEPRYTLLVSQKSQQTNPLQVPQQGPYGGGGPPTGHFAYLSKTSSYGFPSKGALPQGPPNGILRRVMPHHYSLCSSIKVPGIWATPAYQVPNRLDKGPPQRCPDLENFSTYLPGSPVKELPLPNFLHGASSGRETLHPQSPIYHLSKSPADKSSSRFPKRGPYGRRWLSPEPFSTYPTGSPAREPSLQVPLTELPQKETPGVPQVPYNKICKHNFGKF